MRKLDELTDARSCLNKARADEWLFVLLGRDAAAPAAVRAWIDERLRLGQNRPDDPQIAEAYRWIQSVTPLPPAAGGAEPPGPRRPGRPLVAGGPRPGSDPPGAGGLSPAPPGGGAPDEAALVRDLLDLHLQAGNARAWAERAWRLAGDLALALPGGRGELKDAEQRVHGAYRELIHACGDLSSALRKLKVPV